MYQAKPSHGGGGSYIDECKRYWDMVESFTLGEAAALWCDADPEQVNYLESNSCFSVKKRVLADAVRKKRIPFTHKGGGIRVNSRTGWEDRLSVEELLEDDLIMLDREELAKWFEQLQTNDRPAFLFGVDRHIPMPDNSPDAPHEFDDSRHGDSRRHKERVRAIAKLIWKRDPEKTIAELHKDSDMKEIACEGYTYGEPTFRGWVKDLNPRQGKPGRPSGQKG